jgi:HlyD family secretion protein
MLSRRNLIILGLVLAAVVVAGLFFWQQQRAAAQAAAGEVRQETVQRGTILSTVSATGPLATESQVNLFFGAAGLAPVSQVNVALGDVVQQGEVLAQLDTADLELAVEQSRQNLKSAELAVVQLTAPPRPEDLALAEANLRVARAQVFQASQGSRKEQIEIARLNFVLAQNTLTAINDQVDELIAQGNYSAKARLEAQQEQARENARIAELRYQQAQNSGRSGGSALASVEQAEVALERLKRGPEPADLEIAQLQVEQARAALQLAENNLKDAQIVAPFGGVVAAVNVRAGEVPGGQPALILVDISRYYLNVAVDEVDVSRIAAGQAVTITVDALPNDVFSGVVEKIAPQATVNAGVVSYPVRVIVESDDPRLRGGLTATAEIVVQQLTDVVLAPNWAIRRDRTTGQAFASVLRNGQITEIEVRLGLRNENFSEVVSGLSAGDIVAVNTARQQFSFFGGN